MTPEVGDDDSDARNRKPGKPITLYEVLHGKPDPMSPHLEEALINLGIGPAIWQQILEAMAGEIRHAGQRGLMQRAGDSKFVYQRGYRRVEVKEMLEAIAEHAKSINELMDIEEVREALGTHAPLSPREIDDITGFEYLHNLGNRTSRSSAKIRSGPGSDLFRATVGIPSPQLLCAACVSEAMRAIDGRPPGRTNRQALATCRALWLAAGGSDKSPDDQGGLWQRHLSDAKKQTAAARSARLTARSHVAAAVQE
jgi:hypothetical protein